LHKAALRCCCRSPLAADADWRSPLLLAAADSSPSHASADNPPLTTVSQRQLSVLALDCSAAVAARRSATAAARRSAAPLPLRCSATAPCEAAAAFGSLPVLLATWIFAPPQAGEKDERRFEKRNLCSRVPRLRFHVSVFWSHAKSSDVLGGTLGENAAWCNGHGSSTQADGCGLSPAAGPALHVVLCGHRSVFSSPPGRRMFASSHFSTNPRAKVGAEKICPAEYMGSGARCTQERRGLAAYTQLARSSNRRWPHVVRRCNRRKTTTGSRSGASDSSGGRIIFIISMPSSHRLMSRACGNECAASVSTVAYTSALSSVQTYNVRAHNHERCKPPWLASAWVRCTRTWVWAIKRHSFGWKKSVLITNTGVPYKVYNSVPVVLYLKPLRTTGCTTGLLMIRRLLMSRLMSR